MNASGDDIFIWRGASGYETARRGAMWNARIPERYLDVIARPRQADDVMKAVRLARQRNLRIAMRSGGHSWAASFLRDGGMLIDFAAMSSYSIEADGRSASVEPGLMGTDLNRALRPHELFFPTGHCLTVGLGGFLLQGGFGWNSRAWGPACASVTAIDVVTADGELVHCDEKQSGDLFWAARGTGPGFFGAVTRFELKLHARPKVIVRSDYLYPVAALDDVMTWLRAVQPSIARSIECMLFVRRDIFGHAGPGGLVTGPVMADSREEAIEALKLLETCPALGKAVVRETNVVTELDELLQGGDALLYPRERRYAADNMWTHAAASDLLPGMRRIVATLPQAPSHMMWMLWGPPQPLPDMAFSVEDDLYIALYSVWNDPSRDAEHQAWVTDNMRNLEPLSSGIQLADENLAARPFRFMSTDNRQRLETIRQKFDPDVLFRSYMGSPA